jgi:alkylation response protein AidB-like acyl-CoA dehydrogenase
MRFTPTELTPDELALQAEVRQFLAEELPSGSHEPGLGMSARHDKAFSKKMAERGWVGMALPAEWGGHARTAVDRFVVVEEMLRWGAPVGYHWVADRQTGAIINKFGTEEQKARFLPDICAGELGFSIGMSEPDSGSDLASVSTRADRDDGGWIINGTKIWTSNAHQNDWFICLLRTTPLEPEGNKREGLSQMLIDIHNTPGLEIGPIPFLNGEHHFNEVSFTDVFVPDENVVGQAGMGWNQNTTEMAYERGGPDRWLSPFSTVEQLLRETQSADFGDSGLSDSALELFGELTARWWGIRNLSLSVARLIDDGYAPSIESSLVKEMGTRYEIELIEKLVEFVDEELTLDSESLFMRLLSQCVLTGPGNTIRGGTIEILRSVASKGLQGLPA